ncbi:hypothetical protein [Desulfopila sp. IMCC35008]|uniref:hypothetical protein n=1 Tax=Desulfopila sp. IMCC35008 TaxID=2653858 RepID=UPI0013D20E09|nr:hypothetical protein [Desulfopila sp. IMCC35008]
MASREGVKNKTTLARNRLIEGLEPLVIDKLFDLLEKGDTQTVLQTSKILYGDKGFPRKPLGLPKVIDVQTCKDALAKLSLLVNQGKCSSADAARIANIYEKYLSVTELADLKTRIEKLEEGMK